jgi:hypothetical protein
VAEQQADRSVLKPAADRKRIRMNMGIMLG